MGLTDWGNIKKSIFIWDNDDNNREWLQGNNGYKVSGMIGGKDRKRYILEPLVTTSGLDPFFLKWKHEFTAECFSHPPS